MINQNQNSMEIQGSVSELRRLRNEERTLEKMLTEAKSQLMNLEVEALEIKSRMRNTRHKSTAAKENS